MYDVNCWPAPSRNMATILLGVHGEAIAVPRGMAAGSDTHDDFSKFSEDQRLALRARLYDQRARPSPGEV